MPDVRMKKDGPSACQGQEGGTSSAHISCGR